MNKLADFIPTYKDFPRKGISFKDILEVVQEPDVFRELILKMSSNQIIKNSQAIISIDARGFIFGSAIAFQSSKPMIFARKPGKLPGEVIEQNYNLEYGENTISIQKKALSRYSKFAIVDDLIATGGTVESVADLLKKEGKNISGLVAVINLRGIKKKQFNFPVETIISL